MSEENRTIEIRLLDLSWTRCAHPLLALTTGGHRAKAGEWFLEVERVLFDIYQTFKAMENFLNRGHEDMYVGENRNKIEFSDADRIWTLGYMVDNVYLRVGSCLEKIAQMARVYYEHPDHGGPVSVQPRCGNCASEVLTEANCSFGSLVKALHN